MSVGVWFFCFFCFFWERVSNCQRETIALPGIRILQCQSLYLLLVPKVPIGYNIPILGSWKWGKESGFSFALCETLCFPFWWISFFFLFSSVFDNSYSLVCVCVGIYHTISCTGMLVKCVKIFVLLCLTAVYLYLVVPLHKGAKLSGDWKPAWALGALCLIPTEGPSALVMVLYNTASRLNNGHYLGAR